MNVLYSYIPPVDVIQTLKREREREKKNSSNRHTSTIEVNHLLKMMQQIRTQFNV